jgi:asparagine N-glycosylation enzyme membrane subunit Stt3
MAPEKKSKKYVAPVIVAILVVAFTGGLIAMILWAISAHKPSGFILAWLLIYLAVGGGVIGGVIWCLRQRIKEIKGGEEDEARKY